MIDSLNQKGQPNRDCFFYVNFARIKKSALNDEKRPKAVLRAFHQIDIALAIFSWQHQQLLFGVESADIKAPASWSVSIGASKLESAMKIFHRNWPAPPKMSRPKYLRYRLRLLSFLIFWMLGVSIAVFDWGQLHFLLKGILIVLGYVFVPTIEIVEQLLVPYDKYSKEGLW